MEPQQKNRFKIRLVSYSDPGGASRVLGFASLKAFCDHARQNRVPRGFFYDLSGMNLRGADFTNTDLRGASLRGSNLTGARMVGARLDGADLMRTTLRQADMTGASLKKAIISFSRMDGINLTRANLRNASMGQSSLTGAVLTGADLTDASLYRANLTDSGLGGAKLQNTYFFLTIISGADLSGVTCTPHQLSRMIGRPLFDPRTGANNLGAIRRRSRRQNNGPGTPKLTPIFIPR